MGLTSFTQSSRSDTSTVSTTARTTSTRRRQDDQSHESQLLSISPFPSSEYLRIVLVQKYNNGNLSAALVFLRFRFHIFATFVLEYPVFCVDHPRPFYHVNGTQQRRNPGCRSDVC